MKKYLFLICVTILLFGCKKDKSVTPTPPQLDVVGTWSLYSWQQTNLDATVTKYPCLSENILKINSDNTTAENYTGKDTCYIVRPTGPLTSWTAIGIPGQAVVSNTWRRNGNDIYIGSEHSVISNSNGTLFLTTTDTITSGVTSPLILKVVDVKQ